MRLRLVSLLAVVGMSIPAVAITTSPAYAAFCGGTQGNPVLLGCSSNTSTDATEINSSGPSGLAVYEYAAGGVALFGTSNATGTTGVEGDGHGSGSTGVVGNAISIGVFGTAGTYGVEGRAGTGAGVYGSNTGSTGWGVYGATAGNGSAVYGQATGAGTGVYGDTTNGTGVLAHSANGTALWVNGSAHFSQSGVAIVPSGSNHVTVTMAGVTAASMILATVQQGGGFYVKYAQPGTGSITIYINKAPSSPKTVVVAFIVLN